MAESLLVSVGDNGDRVRFAGGFRSRSWPKFCDSIIIQHTLIQRHSFSLLHSCLALCLAPIIVAGSTKRPAVPHR